MRVHRRPRRRSKDSGRSSRSHSADEGYLYKASTASPRVPSATTHTGSDISLEDRPPSPPTPHPEAKWSTTGSSGRRARLGPDQTNVENVSKREDDDWLSPENVRPALRQLSMEGFCFNPGDPHLRHLYLKWLETNQKVPQPYAIEVLTELAEPFTSAPSDVPAAIRINSTPILNFLASLEVKDQPLIKRRKSIIISFPFKILIHYDSAMRNRCNQLQQCLDLLNNKLAQDSSQPDQPHALESSMKEVLGITSSEQSSQIVASSVTVTESESSSGRHPPFPRKAAESILPKSTTQEGSEARAGIQSHSLLSPFEDDSTQGGILKEAAKSVQHDTDDVSKLISRTSVELEHFRCVVAFMDKSIKPHFEAYRSGVHEKVQFRDLWSLFQPGDFILWNGHSQSFRKKPRMTNNSLHRHSSWGSREESRELWRVSATSSESYIQPQNYVSDFKLRAFRIDFNGTSFGPVSFTFSIPHFGGEREVTSLQIIPLRYLEDPENLLREHLEKGKKFLGYSISSPSFWSYKGRSSTFFHNRIYCPHFIADEKEIDSRIVVDFSEAYRDGAGLEQSMPELSLSVREKSGFSSRHTHNRFEFNELPDDPTVDETISKQFQQSDAFLIRYANSELYASDYKDFLGDWELRLLPDRVPAWILSDGAWGLLSVEEVKPVEIDGALWSELRLRKGQKEAILSLAQSHFQEKDMDIKTSTYTNSDCCGVLILLAGPNGVGKTLTAQSLSSLLCKPFYRIRADSLGRDQSEIFRNLHRTFARAEKWHCVLVLEELDALMFHLRNIRCVHMIIRALGEFKGFLVFTSRSWDNITPEFFNYVQLNLVLLPPTRDQFIDIWEAKVDKWNKTYGENMLMNTEDLKKLSHTLWDLNILERISGRTIENIFRCAIALAEQEGHTKGQKPLRLGTEHFATIIEANSQRNISGLLLQPASASSSVNRSSPDRDPGKAAINTTAMILCRDADLHRLFSKLLSQNVLARGFVSDLRTLFELLERYLISEFSPFEEPGNQNALNEDPQKLACAIGACITNSVLPGAKAEAGSPVITQEGSFNAFFESDAFALFKEDLAEVVKLKTKNPGWEAQSPEFLLRGIILEESLTVSHRFQNMLGLLRGPLQSLGLLERPAATGKRRIRWRCRCGKILYDDFSDEMLPKAMQNLLLHTRRMTSRDTDSDSYHKRGLFRRILLGLFGYLGFRGTPSSDATLPFTSDPRVADRSQLEKYEGEEGEVHLLICIDDGKYSSSLFQEAIHDVNCDKGLFQRVNDAYKKRRRQKKSFLSLKAVESIEFATVSTNHAEFVLSSNHSNVCGQWLNLADGEQFHLIFGNIADVRRHERHCNEQRCHCLPPANKVWPKPAAEYRCEPVPPEKSPPIGPNTLMHFLQSPECVAERQRWILKQFPKKIRGKLSAQLDGPVQGWGIHLKEGRNKRKILFFISLSLVMTFIFGIVWSVVMKDVQGGFGVAACCITILGILLTYMDMSGV